MQVYFSAAKRPSSVQPPEQREEDEHNSIPEKMLFFKINVSIFK